MLRTVYKDVYQVHLCLEYARVFLDSAVQFVALFACQQKQHIPILKRMINVLYRAILYCIAYEQQYTN